MPELSDPGIAEWFESLPRTTIRVRRADGSLEEHIVLTDDVWATHGPVRTAIWVLRRRPKDVNLQFTGVLVFPNDDGIGTPLYVERSCSETSFASARLWVLE